MTAVEMGEEVSSSTVDGSLVNDASSPQTAQQTDLAQAWDSKIKSIRLACKTQDVEKLIQAATSRGGFQRDELRRLAWPILLGSDTTVSPSATTWKELKSHKDEEQVALDVNRSFVYYPDDSKLEVETLKEQLQELIVSVLRTHPSLCYFQGYHDIAQVLLLVLGQDAARPALARLSLLRIRDFMLPSLSGAISQLHLLPALLRAADPSLAKYLPSNPFWALAATLTLYAHDVQTYSHIARLFDFLLAQPAIISLYLYAAVIRSRRDDLLEIDPADQDILHVTLTRLPSHRLDFDELIQDTMSLLHAHPPQSLGRPWRSISSSSVLRTASSADAVPHQSLFEGETLLGYQAREAAREARLQSIYNTTRSLTRRYRRPAAITVTVAVAVLAMWLGRGSETFRSGRILDIPVVSFLQSLWANRLKSVH